MSSFNDGEDVISRHLIEDAAKSFPEPLETIVKGSTDSPPPNFKRKNRKHKSTIIDDFKMDLKCTLIEPVQPKKQVFEENTDILPADLSGEEGEGHGHNENEDMKSSVFASAVTLMNTCLGAGFLALAFLMKQWGIILAIVIITGSYLLGLASCYLLLKAKNLCGHSKYSTIGVSSVGKWGERVIKVIIVLNNAGVCMVYLVIFGNSMNRILVLISPALEGSFIASPGTLIIMIATLLVPLAFAKSMDRLKFASLAGVCGITIFSLITFIYFLKVLFSGNFGPNINWLPGSDFELVPALSTLPTAFLSFTFQFNFFPLYKSLQHATDAKMRTVSHLALGIVYFVCVLIGFSGYLIFGSKTGNKGLIFDFSSELLGGFLYCVLMLAFVTCSTLSFPVIFFGARNNMWSLVLSVCKKYKKDWNIKEARRNTHLAIEEILKTLPKTTVTISWKVYALYVAVFYAVVIICSVSSNSIASLLGLIGAITANSIAFLLPAIFYLKLTKTKQRWYKISWVMVVFGVISGMICFGSSLAGLLSNE